MKNHQKIQENRLHLWNKLNEWLTTDQAALPLLVLATNQDILAFCEVVVNHTEKEVTQLIKNGGNHIEDEGFSIENPFLQFLESCVLLEITEPESRQHHFLHQPLIYLRHELEVFINLKSQEKTFNQVIAEYIKTIQFETKPKSNTN